MKHQFELKLIVFDSRFENLHEDLDRMVQLPEIRVINLVC